jgi:hypothetical protein
MFLRNLSLANPFPSQRLSFLLNLALARMTPLHPQRRTLMPKAPPAKIVLKANLFQFVVTFIRSLIEMRIVCMNTMSRVLL